MVTFANARHIKKIIVLLDGEVKNKISPKKLISLMHKIGYKVTKRSERELSAYLKDDYAYKDGVNVKFEIQIENMTDPEMITFHTKTGIKIDHVPGNILFLKVLPNGETFRCWFTESAERETWEEIPFVQKN